MRKMGMGWLWGLVLILLGIGFLLNSLGISSAHDFLVAWWPVIFVIIGLGEIISGNSYNGTFWLIIGVVLGLFTTGAVSYNGDLWQIIWPLILILMGLRFILRPAFRMRVVSEENFTGSTAVFSGSNKKINSKDFKGSKVSAVFGGAKLDLRDATISKDGAVIDVSTVFGGIEILVPKKTPVKMDVAAIFGGHEDKRDTSQIDEKLPTIVIRGEAIFGGVEIKD